MEQRQLQTLAQELVDLKIEAKRIENDMLQLKLEIFENAEGGIQCNGGRISYIAPRDIRLFDKEILKNLLVREFGLNDQNVEDLFIRSSRLEHREAQINIYLDQLNDININI